MSARRRMTIKRLRKYRCRECGVAQGQLHVLGCWRERCARCGGQAVFCGHNDDPIVQLPRVPFIDWVNVCASCGLLHPEFFDVPNCVWRHYIEPEKRDKIICEPCFVQIAGMIDAGAYLSRYGGPVALWSREFRRRHGVPPDEQSPWDGTTEAEASPR